MPYVPVPKDLTKVKTKLAAGLTKRQLICFSLAALVGLPMYFITRGVIGNSAAVLLMIGLMMPFFFFAMYERDGQPAEKLLKIRLRYKLWPKKRPYRTENLYRTMSKKEVITIAKNQTAGGPGKASAKKYPAGKKDQGRRKKKRD
ncbi:PrgI family protein [Candidatus Bariatricus faecipullorum]